jgi:RNA exonuclease 1
MTLVDWDGSVIVDMLVKPESPILDYNTKYSGITASMMENVSTTMEEARSAFLTYVSRDTIVVGHALENDFKTLGICHTKVLDSSILFPHPSGLPYRCALRNLAKKYLKKVIQIDEHDSVEDAVSALELIKLKLLKGKQFGLKERNSIKLFELLEKQDKKIAIIDRLDLLQKIATPSAHLYPRISDIDKFQTLRKCIQKPNHCIAFTRIDAFWDRSESLVSSYDLMNLVNELESIFNECSSGTLLFVISGQVIVTKDDPENSRLIKVKEKGALMFSIKQ